MKLKLLTLILIGLVWSVPDCKANVGASSDPVAPMARLISGSRIIPLYGAVYSPVNRSSFLNSVMSVFRICPGTNVQHARTWLMWLGIGMGGYLLLCLLLLLLANVRDGKFVFFRYLLMPLVLLLPALIPLGLMSYVFSNINQGHAIWFMNDANGFGWIGFMIWCAVCFAGAAAIIDAIKSLFTFWRRNIVLTLVSVIGGVAWTLMFWMAIIAIMAAGNDFLILAILVTLAALSGGAYKSATTKGSLMDFYGRETEGTFDGNRFHGNDGNTYSRDNHGDWSKD